MLVNQLAGWLDAQVVPRAREVTLHVPVARSAALHIGVTQQAGGGGLRCPPERLFILHLPYLFQSVAVCVSHCLTLESRAETV